MIRQAASLRRLGPWLIGLFIIASIADVRARWRLSWTIIMLILTLEAEYSLVYEVLTGSIVRAHSSQGSALSVAAQIDAGAITR